MNFCDVIIPIYNAFDATVNCIESVIKNTDLTKDRLILVNDCSPDERISKHINSVKEQYPQLNIVVIENEKNKGFVGTVNVGMRYSDNDVLLLNSDTIVGKDWLNKMRACAYSQPKVASVTAMSNNATLASVPKPLTRNEIPQDLTIDEYNDLLTKCAYRDYPELPTSHGFCVYITREILLKAGLFDEESFGRGYGEENDFSYRCLDYGYKNLLCDDVVVYHLESQSFSGERSKVIEKHLQILQNRYPTYSQDVEYWCTSLPIAHICKNVDFNLNLRKKPNVLVLIHEWENVIGGTTIHVKDIVKSLTKDFNFHVLFPGDRCYIVESFFGDEVLRTVLPVNIVSSMKFNRYNREYGVMVENLVKAFGITSVHVHHMVNHFFDIATIIKKYNLNSIITLHDYYSVCPNSTLLYCSEQYCMDMPKKDCGACLKATNRAANNIVDQWRLDWNEFLKTFDKVIVPSDDAKQKIQQVYSDIEITAIEHGVNKDKADDNLPTIEGKIKVAFMGVLCKHKGSDMIGELIDHRNPHIEYHAFGKSEYADLTQNTSNYIYHGTYEREELSKLLKENKINVICFLQICPETYSYTTNEAVSAGIPVLTLDIGAGAERTKKYGFGWVLPKNSTYKDVINKLISIKNNPEEYALMLQGIKNYKFKTVAEMAQEYKALYDIKKTETNIDYEALRQIIKQEGMCAGGSAINNSAALTMLDSILRSAKWRIVSKIKIPRVISRPAKKVLKGIIKLLKR